MTIGARLARVEQSIVTIERKVDCSIELLRHVVAQLKQQQNAHVAVTKFTATDSLTVASAGGSGGNGTDSTRRKTMSRPESIRVIV